MALNTIGTSATNTLRGLVMNSNLSPADAATLRANIKHGGRYLNGAWTQIQNHSVIPGSFEFQGQYGLLYIPGDRGVLKVYPGDVVAYDPNGWPILISGWSLNGSGSTGWTHVP